MGSPHNTAPLRGLWLAGFLATVLASGPLGSTGHAATVRNINTGWDNVGGTVLPAFAVDTDFTVTGPNGVLTPEVRDDATMPDVNDDVFYNQEAAMPGSRWLLLINSGGHGANPVGQYQYRTTVDLTGFDHTQAVIDDLTVSADNAFDSVVINGVVAFDANPGPGVQEAGGVFPLGDVGQSFFQAGVNTIDFLVNNYEFPIPSGGGAPSQTAFRALADVEAPLAPSVASNASFDTPADLDVLNLDFGSVAFGSSPAALPFDIHNLVGAGTTAHVILDTVVGSGDTAALSSDLAPFLGLAAGDTNSYAAQIDTSLPGDFDASYELSFTDVLGNDQTLTLNLSGVVELTDDPAIPDLVYDAATGEVVLDPDASSIIGYTLQNTGNGFLPGGHTPVLGGVSTSLPGEISEAALSPGFGSIGFIMPAGLSEAALVAFLDVNQVSTGLGAPLVPFDLIVLNAPAAVPEPSTWAMAMLGLLSLAIYGYRKTRTSSLTTN